jgi:vacuolar-type H+-ATPase subunit F/Vma7
MAGRCVFIGDEITAAGLRLAGVECHVPEAHASGAELAALFRGLRDGTGLVMITAEVAERLPGALVAEALREQRPPTLVIADIRRRLHPPDMTTALKRQLGLAE